MNRNLAIPTYSHGWEHVEEWLLFCNPVALFAPVQREKNRSTCLLHKFLSGLCSSFVTLYSYSIVTTKRINKTSKIYMNHLVPQQPVMFKDIQKHRHQTHGFPLQLGCIIPLRPNHKIPSLPWTLLNSCVLQGNHVFCGRKYFLLLFLHLQFSNISVFEEESK